jgi:hypothetical protein
MPKNYKSEKPKGGVVEGVAYANGKGGYIPFSSNTAKTYGGQARAAAAKNSLRKGY